MWWVGLEVDGAEDLIVSQVMRIFEAAALGFCVYLATDQDNHEFFKIKNAVA